MGDVVDYAFTVTGENPVLGGRFADTFYIGSAGSVEEFTFRLVWPADKPLAIKTQNTDLQPLKQTIGGETEYVWHQRYVRAVNSDGSTPSWFSPYPRVTISEFQDWTHVVDWALPYYTISPISDSALQAMVDKWKKTLKSPEERAIAALRFVQDEIRYLGIELGRYSHEPTRPEKVFARRFGDCKDKSLLLATMYMALGIEAAPALVNSFAKSSLDSWQASPFAFDHVIVKANIDGRTYWFDPTISYQRGTLENYYPPLFERALVLQKGSQGLEPILVEASKRGSIDVVERYSREDVANVTLTVETTYRGAEADQMRYRLSVSTMEDLGKGYLNFYAESSPSISADASPAVQDDESTNTLTITEKYSIAELWKDNRHQFLAEKIWVELGKPRVSQRSMPLAVSYPLSIRHSIVVDLGPGYALPLTSEVIADDSLRYEYRYTKNGNQLRVDYYLQTFRDSVPLDKVPQHLAVLDRAQQSAGFELPNSSVLVVATASRSRPQWLVGFGAIVILLMVIFAGGGFLFWLLRSPLKQGSPTSAITSKPVGSSPETALRVSSDEDLERTLSSYTCRCGNRPYIALSELQQQRLTYDGERILVVQLKCQRCTQGNDVYLKLASDPRQVVIRNPASEVANN